MAFTFGLIEEDARAIGSGSDSTQVELYVTATGPVSYSAGGEAIVVARDFGLSAIKHFSCEELDNGTTLRKLTYDRTNTKLRAWLMAAVTEGTSGTGTQVIWVEQTAADDLHTYTYRMRIVGTRKTVSTLA